MSKKLIYGSVGANQHFESILVFIRYIAKHKQVNAIWYRRQSSDNIALVYTIFSSTVIKALFL